MNRMMSLLVAALTVCPAAAFAQQARFGTAAEALQRDGARLVRCEVFSFGAPQQAWGSFNPPSNCQARSPTDTVHQ